MARLPTHGFVTLVLGACLAVHGIALGEGGGCDAKRDVAAGALDEWTWRRLNSIYEAVGEARYDQAFEDLTGMLERTGRDSYLRAVLNQALAQVEWARGRYAASLGYSERAVALDALPDDTHFALLYQIAQIHYKQDRFDAALAALQRWKCAIPPEGLTSAAYLLEAAIQARREDHAAALAAIEQAIALDESPHEDWFLLKLAAHYELEQWPQAAATLETLVARWPGKKAHWMQLAQVCDRLGRDSRALAVLALAHRQGLLDQEADLAYLSWLYSRAGLPYKAAEVLENGIRAGSVAASAANWTRVADAWYAAAELEHALAAYREAGRASADGELDLRRAHILVDLERWPAAVEALDQALRAGGLDDRRMGEAFLLRGMARYNLEQFDRAAADWERAGRYETAREAAGQWLNHLREERGRSAS